MELAVIVDDIDNVDGGGSAGMCVRHRFIDGLSNDDFIIFSTVVVSSYRHKLTKWIRELEFSLNLLNCLGI